MAIHQTKGGKNSISKDIWINELPFKMAFIMWRIWKVKVPVDENLRRWRLQGPTKSWCCTNLN